MVATVARERLPMPIFLVTISYTRPLPEIEAATDDHRAYLRTLLDAGRLLVSGPLVPRTGGMMILQASDASEVEALIAQDPFCLRKLARYETRQWNPVMGAQRLA